MGQVESEMGKLTTHVLDLTSGRPAAGLKIDLYRLNGDVREHVTSRVTNDDGRVDSPLLEGDEFTVGIYESVFQAGKYLCEEDPDYEDNAFLGEVLIRFQIADASEHYHVPLLLSNYGYSTYRGS